MPKAGSDKQLDVFNSVVSMLAEFDEDTQAHILSAISRWLQLEPVRKAQRTSISLAPVGPLEEDRFSQRTDMSPKVFLVEKGPSTNVERIACIAYFLTHFRDTPNFQTLEISKLNTESAQPKFANASYSVRDAVGAGFLVPAPGRDKKQLSAMGEQFVLALPDRDAARAILHKMRRRKSKRATRKKSFGTDGT